MESKEAPRSSSGSRRPDGVGHPAGKPQGPNPPLSHQGDLDAVLGKLAVTPTESHTGDSSVEDPQRTRHPAPPDAEEVVEAPLGEEEPLKVFKGIYPLHQ